MLLQVETTVITDHLNLTYWMEPRQLSPRQARWVDLLSMFRFQIKYRPGRQAGMPDALSRRSDYHPGKGSTTNLEANFVQALPSMVMSNDNDGNDNSTTLRALQRPVSIHRDYFVSDRDIIEGLTKDDGLIDVLDEMKSLVCINCNHPTCRTGPNVSIHLASVEKLRRRSRNKGFRNPSWDSRGFLVFGRRVYLPDNNNARLKVIKARHDAPLAGHPGINGTIDLVSRDYIWVGLRETIEAYVKGCSVCQRTKLSHLGPIGYLKPLEVATQPWTEISMDFVEQLPRSGPHDSILVVVDRLTKWAIFIPTTTTLGADGLANLLRDHVFAQHGLPKAIVSDRGSKFVSQLWRTLTSRLGINLRLSTAFHPQTDGQTERVNQVLEQYLRIFTAYQQTTGPIYYRKHRLLTTTHFIRRLRRRRSMPTSVSIQDGSTNLSPGRQPKANKELWQQRSWSACISYAQQTSTKQTEDTLRPTTKDGCQRPPTLLATKLCYRWLTSRRNVP